MSGKNFGNKSVLTESWYFAMSSKKLKQGKVTPFFLHANKIALFRGANGKVTALKSRCPHLGADLCQGTVEENSLQCPFHGWKFNGVGKCNFVPNESAIPQSAKTHSYPVVEKYGAIWVCNGEAPKFQIPDFNNVEIGNYRMFVRDGKEVKIHNHLLSCNGFDVQHWQSLHGMETMSKPEFKEVSPYHLQIKYHFKASKTHPSYRKLKLLGLATVKMNYETIGGNISLVKVQGGKNRFIVVLAPSPTTDGTSFSKISIGIPKASLVGKILFKEYFQLIKALLGLVAVLKDDREVLENVEFWPRLTEQDEHLLTFINQVNSLETFEA